MLTGFGKDGSFPLVSLRGNIIDSHFCVSEIRVQLQAASLSVAATTYQRCLVGCRMSFALMFLAGGIWQRAVLVLLVRERHLAALLCLSRALKHRQGAEHLASITSITCDLFEETAPDLSRRKTGTTWL